MQIGRMAEIDNAQQNHSQKVEKVNEVTDDNKIISDEEYKKTLGSSNETEKIEVMLDNVKFGFNKDSRDFFVKITKGNSEFKYPTEDMMKVKAFLLQELNEIEKTQG